MVSFADLKDRADSASNVRKALEGFAFLAPMSADLPETIIAADGGLFEFPEEWWGAGIVGTDGYEFESDIDKEETEGWGYSDPVRTDINKVAKTVKFTAYETDKRQFLEFTLGMDLSAVTATAQGEVVFEEPDLPDSVEQRLIVVYRDGTLAKPYYRAKGFSRVKLGDLGSMQWGQEAISQEVTCDVQVGPEGFAVRQYIAGAAFDLTANGWAPATP